MGSLYFELVDNDLVFELSSRIDITSDLNEFLSSNDSEIELALLGYFAGKKKNPKREVKKVKASILRQIKQGATSFSVFID